LVHQLEPSPELVFLVQPDIEKNSIGILDSGCIAEGRTFSSDSRDSQIESQRHRYSIFDCMIHLSTVIRLEKMKISE